MEREDRKVIVFFRESHYGAEAVWITQDGLEPYLPAPAS